jgi:UDP-3-O-[3-hydroxymyristoyl] glucosamine N-acyltransferase
MTKNSKTFDVNATAMIDSSVIFGQACQNISVGHGSQIRAGVYIDVIDLKIGDYVTINPGTVLHGNKLTIGHNCWIGQYTILDAYGSQLLIGNNCGVGAHSQLWSHMKFGDMLAGCQWHNMSELIIEDDVWFVGHCLVSPIRAKKSQCSCWVD